MASIRKNASDHSNMNPMYKPAASPGPAAMSAKSHQVDLARISANTAGRNALKSGKNMDAAGSAYGAADARASKSFGIKSDASWKSRY